MAEQETFDPTNPAHVKVESDGRKKATIKGIKAYFGGDAPEVKNQEVLNLKREDTEKGTHHYDEIAYGIGDGTFTY